jgi:hypothetical protein
MMSDNQSIVATIDANAAIDSNCYADPIKTNGRPLEQMKLGSGSFIGPETVARIQRRHGQWLAGVSAL